MCLVNPNGKVAKKLEQINAKKRVRIKRWLRKNGVKPFTAMDPIEILSWQVTYHGGKPVQIMRGK